MAHTVRAGGVCDTEPCHLQDGTSASEPSPAIEPQTKARSSAPRRATEALRADPPASCHGAIERRICCRGTNDRRPVAGRMNRLKAKVKQKRLRKCAGKSSQNCPRARLQKQTTRAPVQRWDMAVPTPRSAGIELTANASHSNMVAERKATCSRMQTKRRYYAPPPPPPKKAPSDDENAAKTHGAWRACRQYNWVAL